MTDSTGVGDQVSRQVLEYCTVEDDGPVRTVTINRPEVMNALNSEASHELERVWDEFAARDDLWVGIITGAGERAFSAGNDMKRQAAGTRGPRPRNGFGGLTLRFDLYKPVIAAVNGVAMGGGFEMALACDIIVAEEHAIFALPEPRVGTIAGGGGVHRLARVIPNKQARGMILTGRRVSAQEGKELGFVNEVVPTGRALEGARRWADQILECSPVAVRAAKQTIDLGLDEASVKDAINKVYPLQQACVDSQDFIEGHKAFVEKRKPIWQNA
jgi:enoyl-CoA hydratase/carnithine racemase